MLRTTILYVSTQRFHALFSLFGVLLLSTGGCGDDGASPSFRMVTPAAGSTFTVNVVDLDASGAAVAGTGKTVNLSVTGRNHTIFDRAAVTTFSAPDEDPLYVTYESTGDLSLFVAGQTTTHTPGSLPFRSPNAWITLPFGSKSAERVVIDYDTTGLSDGRILTFTVRHTVQYLSSEQMQVGSETFTAHKVLERINRVESTPDATYGAEYVTTYWYAPTIGFFTRIDWERTDTTATWTGAALS